MALAKAVCRGWGVRSCNLGRKETPPTHTQVYWALRPVTYQASVHFIDTSPRERTHLTHEGTYASPLPQAHPLLHTHTHTGVLFGACQLVTLHTQPKAKQARSSVTLSSHGLLLPPPGLVKTLLGTTPRVIQNVGTYP